MVAWAETVKMRTSRGREHPRHKRRLDLIPSLPERHRDLQLLLRAEDRHLHRVPGTMAIHHLGQGLLAIDFFSVDGDNQVSANHDRSVAEVGAIGAAAQSGAVSGTSRDSLYDEKPVVGGEAEVLRNFGINRDGTNTESGTAHAPERHQIVDHGLGCVDRNREADAGALPYARRDHCVDANHFAVPVEQWPP